MSPRAYVETEVARYGLRGRQAEIFRLAIEGGRREEIADRLGVSINTMKGHVQRLLIRTGADSLDHLRLRALRAIFAEPDTQEAAQ